MLRTSFLFCLSLLAASNALSVDEFYPFGEEEGDTMLFRNDDMTSAAVSLTGGFPFFGQTRNYLWLATNGILSTDQPIREWTPKAFPLTQSYQMIAPFWADLDTRCFGNVSYRSSVDQAVLQRASSEVGQYFPKNRGFQATFAFVSTWYDVPAFSAQDCSLDYPERDTFQCVLVTDGSSSFALFLYGEIDWTLGQASGGVHAEVGFDAGDGINYFKVAESLTAEIINIQNTSNVGIDGIWAFQINEAHIVTAKPPPTRPTNKVTHWHCDNNGAPGCKCTPGWTGERCDIPIDYCTNPPQVLKGDVMLVVPFCGQNGYCNYNRWDGSKCICDEGYFGDFCQHMNKTKRVSDRCITGRTNYTMRNEQNKTAVETTYMCNMSSEICVPDNMNCYNNYPPMYRNGQPFCQQGWEYNDRSMRCQCQYPIGWCVPAHVGGYLVRNFFKAKAQDMLRCNQNSPLGFRSVNSEQNVDMDLEQLHDQLKMNAARMSQDAQYAITEVPTVGNTEQAYSEPWWMDTTESERNSRVPWQWPTTDWPSEESTGHTDFEWSTARPDIPDISFEPAQPTGWPRPSHAPTDNTDHFHQPTSPPTRRTTYRYPSNTPWQPSSRPTLRPTYYPTYPPTTSRPSRVDFTCDNYAEPYCTCEPGWTGPECEIPINYCNTPPQVQQNHNMITVPFCGENGHCDYDPSSGTSCHCDEGYYGDFCQHMRKTKYVADRCIMRATQYTNAHENHGHLETVYECNRTAEICIPDDMDCYRSTPSVADIHGHRVCNGYGNRELDPATQRCICEYPVGWCIPSHVANMVVKNYFKADAKKALTETSS